jgi:hypothetical protein
MRKQVDHCFKKTDAFHCQPEMAPLPYVDHPEVYQKAEGQKYGKGRLPGPLV